jgi:hypothetical protein
LRLRSESTDVLKHFRIRTCKYEIVVVPGACSSCAYLGSGSLFLMLSSRPTRREALYSGDRALSEGVE